MIFLYLILSLLLTNQIEAIPQECLEVINEIITCDETDTTCTATQEIEINICEIDPDESKSNCDFTQQIQQTDQGISPRIITQSGQYCVVDNLTVPANTNGIVIQTDNVIIDLNGFSITGQTNSLNGILVTRGVSVTQRSNITIKNGVIKNMGNNGILVNTSGRLFTFKNLKIFNNVNNGISITNNKQFTITNCITNLNRGNGLFLTRSGAGSSQNCVIQNCLSMFNSIDGIQLFGCTNFKLSNVLCLNNQVDGFDEITGNRIRFESCQAHNNGRTGTTGVGFFSSGNNHSFNQCQANNNTTIGFQINGNQENLDNCEAKGNGTDGFCIAGNNNSFANCSGTFNGANGFNIIGGNQHSIWQCEAESNTTNGYQITGANHCILNSLAKNNPTNAASTGILLLAGSTQCQVRSNTTVANTTGISNNTTTVNRIYSNYSSDNITNFFGVPNVSVSPGIATAINFTANIAN